MKIKTTNAAKTDYRFINNTNSADGFFLCRKQQS